MSAEQLDPELRATNGFDFRNDVDGDTYIFLLGDSLSDWEQSRKEFLQLTGPCPLLPDWAYGTWFTRWYNYTQSEAEEEVQMWEQLQLPLDVWGLDMNWRNTSSVGNEDYLGSVGNSDGSDWYYDKPDTVLFPDFSSWFGFLQKKGLRTYFNDHPYPVAARGAGGLQTSPEEVDFRWEGLSNWLDQGIDLWWFDRNWRFSIPPPMVNSSRTGAVWEGLDNAAWGSYVYYKTTEVFDQSRGDNRRSLALTKNSPVDWRDGTDGAGGMGDSIGQQEHPSQHRYPVWWTGDGVPLRASVQSMVNAGVHDLKPFVHSDCGGDYRGSAGDMLRWTAHCAFGTILRFHGSDHRPWSYTEGVTATVKRYLDARYKLMPTLIAAGQRATSSGFPLAARGDLYWPDLAPASASSDQYIFLEDLLVAPIWDSDKNVTSRDVWLPPGSWEDAWDGSVLLGPKNLTATQPYERQPMWFRRGGLLITTQDPKNRVQEQDWDHLVLESFPEGNMEVQRSLFERDTAERTDLMLKTETSGFMSLNISAGASRAWTLRLHLLPEQSVEDVKVDGSTVTIQQLPPLSKNVESFPFGGVGSKPPSRAGPVAEVLIPRAAHARHVQLNIRSQVLVTV
jgi:alpha-glucosidase (family GH31 glycosyl hydrolase)